MPSSPDAKTRLFQRAGVAEAIAILAAISSDGDDAAVYWLRKWHAAEADRLNNGGAPNEDYSWIDELAEEL